ncbi:Uncharacterised protein [Vibrio cholerae]|nr:Uncharacterised protein [Vibrio cholerae]
MSSRVAHTPQTNPFCRLRRDRDRAPSLIFY